MFGLNDDADAAGFQDFGDGFSNIGGEFFLNLQTARIALHDAGEFGNTDDTFGWQVADMGVAGDGQHVVFAEADDADVAQHDQFIIAADFLENAFEIFARVGFVAGKKFAIGTHHAGRRVEQTFAVGVFTGPADQRAHGGFGFAACRYVLCFRRRLLCGGRFGFGYFLGGHYSFPRQVQILLGRSLWVDALRDKHKTGEGAD